MLEVHMTIKSLHIVEHSRLRHFNFEHRGDSKQNVFLPRRRHNLSGRYELYSAEDVTMNCTPEQQEANCSHQDQWATRWQEIQLSFRGT
jgi:hypothetical protein